MSNFVNITDFGAKEGLLSTRSIQKAFDEANKAGGLTVVIPRGIYITGTINMGNASIYLEKGAVLKASPNPKDYRDNGFVHNEMKKTISLLYSLCRNNISITGEGTIDLSGSSFFNYKQREVPDNGYSYSREQILECTAAYAFRPTQPIFFYQCNNINISGIRISDSPNWTLCFHDCENIHIDNLTIDNDLVIPNNDGMHFCGCRRVFVRGCNISSGDDCIALSSITDWNIACEDFVISDCILRSSSKAVSLGYMHSIIRNITISNCIIKDSNRGISLMSSTQTGLIEHVLIENVRIETRVRAGNWWGNGEPICIFALYHHNPDYLFNAPDRNFSVNINDVQLRNISCLGENLIGIIGIRDNIQNIIIDGIYYERKESKNACIKGTNTIDAAPSPESIPSPGTEISYWIYSRGCKNLNIKNAAIQDFKGVKLDAYTL